MTGEQFRKIVGDAKAFRDAAWLVECRIQQLQTQDGDTRRIGGSKGWRSHDVWESLKTVSHFNLFNAFELGLKCLLEVQGISPIRGREGHLLAVLYDSLPDEIARKLDDMFRKEIMQRPFVLKAVARTDTPRRPDSPRSRPLRTLRDFCAYFDEDAKLWMKRYSWEDLTSGQYVHYLDKLDALLAFLEQMENLGTTWRSSTSQVSQQQDQTVFSA